MSSTTVQHTIRGIPTRVDKALRQQSRKAGRSLNQVAVDALARGLGVADEPALHHDLDTLAGTWADDADFDRAIKVQDQIDKALWK